MGLVYCPKCGEEISDKAISCPHCNFAFSKQNIVKCEECGMEYESNLSACPKCGCPKPSFTEKTQKSKHKGIIISIISVALIAVFILGFSITQKAKGQQKSPQRKQKYIDKVHIVLYNVHIDNRRDTNYENI